MNIYRCCKPLKNKACSKNENNITKRIRDKLKKISGDKFDECLRICSACSRNLMRVNVDEVDVNYENSQVEAHNNHSQMDEDHSQDEGSLNDLDEIEMCFDVQAGQSLVRQELITPSLICVKQSELIDSLNNNVLPHLSEDVSPIKKKRSEIPSYMHRKSKELSNSIQKVLSKEVPDSHEQSDDKVKKMLDNILKNMKRHFDNGDSSEKLKILTLLPSDMPTEEIKGRFGEKATTFLIKKSKKMVQNLTSVENEMQILKKGRKKLLDETKEIVESFYNDDEISRIMPGKNDFVTVRNEGISSQIQKRLMLSSIGECYTEFKRRHPTVKIGKTSFTTLRPKHCKILGVGNQQNVCVCTTHQNMKLMVDQCHFNMLILENQQKFKSYKDVIEFVLCDDANGSDKCFFKMCDKCSQNLKKLSDLMIQNFENLGIFEIKYKKWTNTDRCNLETLVDDVEEFVKNFCKHLRKLIPHNFIAKQQSQFVKNKMESIKPGEILVQLDFAENYSFIVQDATQGFHWNNAQSTVHPFVIYYRNNNEGPLEHKSFVIISDCKNHDSIAVHLFIQKMIEFIRHKSIQMDKISYVSDGAGSQYKNKNNFINLCHHENDFGVKAEWHFHATSHGKSACDGVGGILKRGAYRFSLANKDTIQTPMELYEWSKSWKTEIETAYCSSDEYLRTKTNLQDRYQTAATIQGTQSLHSFYPINLTSLKVKKYSNSLEINQKSIVSKR